MKRFRIDDYQMDVLKEIGNIGAGHAATALSVMINKQVDMQVPNARLVPFDQIADSIGGEEQVVAAVYLRVTGDVTGNMFFVISLPSSKKLLKKMLDLDVADDHFSELELSALSEIGNILAGSYLSSMSDFTRLKLQPTVPALAIDMAGAIMSYGMLAYGQMGEHALFIDTMFWDGSDEVEGHFFLIPDPEAVGKIFQALGVPYT